jgi:hypothetical protein
MSAPCTTIARRVARLPLLLPLLAALAAGCGSGTYEVDKAALYTPESLAGELIFRFRQLSPEAQKAEVRFKLKPKDEKKLAERRARSEQAKNKLTGGPPARKKQKGQGPPSVDDLLTDIDDKLDRMSGVPRADACKKMTETIAADNSLSDGDKKQLTELVGRVDGSH